MMMKTKNILAVFIAVALFSFSTLGVIASEIEDSLSTGPETSGITGGAATPPTASPVAGTYTSTQTVTLTASGATTICYTIDGTDSSCESSTECSAGVTTYTGPITISSDTTINTNACYPENTPSDSASHVYTISAAIPPPGGGSYTPTTTTTTTKPVVVSACQWCGFFCTKIESWMSCPTVTLPSGYICTEVNGVCSKVIGVATTTTTVPTGVTTTTTISPVTVIDIPVEFTFQNNLKQGMVSEDIRHLQRFLNSHAGTQIAASGLGSPGMETNYFGALTKVAVIKFQNMYASEILTQWGLTKGNGYVGQSTRKKLNELLAGQVPTTTTTIIPSVTTTTTVPGVTTTTTISPVTVTGIPAGFIFQKTLWKGSVSEDVRYLQRFLNSHAGTQIAASGLGSPGMETNYFGALTKAAVIKFQNMYASEILAQWGLTKGNGYVGQSTRKKLNELLGE